MLVLGGTQPELLEDVRDVLLHHGLTDVQCPADSPVGFTLGHRRKDLELPWAESIHWGGSPAATQHPRDELRVECRPAIGDPGRRVDEGLYLTDSLLEQVSDSVGTVGEQVERVALLEVLREDQQACLGPPLTYLQSRAQPIVAMTWRHVDIGNHQVRAVGESLAQQVLGIAGLSHDIKPGLREQPRDALP